VITVQHIDRIDAGQKALVRIDINSPLIDGEVQDNKRFERHATTLQQLLEMDTAVIAMAHQGRPGRDDFTSLEQHASILEGHLDTPVRYKDAIHSRDARQAIQDIGNGEILLLENVRFLSEELKNLPPENHAKSLFVQRLSQEADCYINDAFSASHRSHASLTGFAPVIDSYTGTVMHEELHYTEKIRDGLEGRTIMLAGGSKPSDVLTVMDKMADNGRVDEFLLGGVIAKLFLREQGREIGEDGLVRKTYRDNREAVRRLLDEHGDSIRLPVDYAREHGGDRQEEQVGSLAGDRTYLDIGSDTVDDYRSRIDEADSIVVKGAPGAFEQPSFQQGTAEILDAIRRSDAFSVVGGGDTSSALRQLGIPSDGFDHLSIAGGAYIRSLVGEELAAVEALRKFS